MGAFRRRPLARAWLVLPQRRPKFRLPQKSKLRNPKKTTFPFNRFTHHSSRFTPMAKTQVILTHNIVGLGGESDHVKVAAGYARNYLFPQGLAIPLTAATNRRIEVLKQRRGDREAHELNTMSEL